MGIWKIKSVDQAGGSAVLEDAATNRMKLDDFGESDRVSTHRLIRYAPTWDPAVEESKRHRLERVVKGDIVAIVHEGEIVLMRIDAIDARRRMTGELMRVPKPERHGGFARRPWSETGEERRVPWDQLLGRVALTESECLTPDSPRWVSKWAGTDLK